MPLRMTKLRQQNEKTIQAEIDQPWVKTVQPRDDALDPGAHVTPPPPEDRARGAGR